jgi:BlaI family transcriptional regulator, penicillinase repressor
VPRRKQLAITERQFEVLSLLWEYGPMTVREIRERMDRKTDLPYTTVLGLLQVMERAAQVTHDVESQTHRYRPQLSRLQGTSQLLGDFVKKFFRGAASELVLGLVDARQLSAADLRELEAKFAGKRKKVSGETGSNTAAKKLKKKANSRRSRP